VYRRKMTSSLLKEGTKYLQGVEGAILQNLEAVQELSKVCISAYEFILRLLVGHTHFFGSQWQVSVMTSSVLTVFQA
jgi:hypothetical protein